MKIVVTGASGYVGRALVPLLVAKGAEVIVVGREPDKLQSALPDTPAYGYDELGKVARRFDLLINLATVNNNSNASDEEFQRINVDFALKLLNIANDSKIGRFINLSSIHALDPSNNSAYARTKRKAAQLLRDQEFTKVTTVYLPAVVTSHFAGKLAVLNHFPKRAQRMAFTVLSSLRPTLHIHRLADTLTNPDALSHELVLSDTQLHNQVYQAIKRGIDLIFSLSVVIFLWWLLAALYIAVRVESKGPGLFRQKRVGRDGHEFVCYKFRSMALGTPNVATHDVAPQAVTRIGKWMRRSKLDELPQVLNILRNEMTLIGPRPCLPSQMDLIEQRRRCGVLALKPGISGYAQVNGVDMSDPKELAKWDARYMALQSLLLDLKIGLATLFGKGGGDRVR